MDQSPRERALLRLREIEDEARMLRTFILMYDKLTAGSRAPPDPPTPSPTDTNVREGHSDQFASKDEIYAAVREILHNETEPMHIAYLYKLVTSKGLKISGLNPKGNLSAKLAPFKDIVYVKEKGWILAENLSRKHEAPYGHVLDGTSASGDDDEL